MIAVIITAMPNDQVVALERIGIVGSTILTFGSDIDAQYITPSLGLFLHDSSSHLVILLAHTEPLIWDAFVHSGFRLRQIRPPFWVVIEGEESVFWGATVVPTCP
jgi:hypothetical protein